VRLVSLDAEGKEQLHHGQESPDRLPKTETAGPERSEPPTASPRRATSPPLQKEQKDCVDPHLVEALYQMTAERRDFREMPTDRLAVNLHLQGYLDRQPLVGEVIAALATLDADEGANTSKDEQRDRCPGVPTL
jgi:hypothetical protein